MSHAPSNRPEPFRFPPSGVVLGAIAKALHLDPVTESREIFSDRTLLRFFDGEQLDDEWRGRVLAAYADSVLKAGLIPLPPGLQERGRDLLGGVISAHAILWDALRGWLGGAGVPALRPRSAPRPFLRLGVIDLALRAGAVASLVESPFKVDGGTDTPPWATGEDGGSLLKSLMARCEPRLTREMLKKRLDGSRHIVDRWLSGKNTPSPENIQKLGDIIGPLVGTTAQEVSGAIRSDLALHRLADALASHVGRKQVIWLAQGFVRLRGRVVEQLRKTTQEQRVALALLGCRAPLADDALKALWDTETNRLWATEIRAAAGDWLDRLQQAMRTMSAPDQPEFKRQLEGLDPELRAVVEKWSEHEDFLDAAQADMTRMTPAMLKAQAGADGKWVRVVGDNKMKAMNRPIQADQALADGDLQSQLVHIRRAAQLQPESAEHQFKLGCTLWQLGDFEEGLKACWLAHGLSREWDRPLVEIGIIYLNTGRVAEALEHMEDSANRVAMTPWLALHRGAARMRMEKLAEALDDFDFVLRATPDDGRALDFAAHCGFMLGHDRRAPERAKRARGLGWPSSFDRSEAGYYRVARDAAQASKPAKRAFAQGELSFLEGDRAAEVQHLREAARLDAENADYRLRLGAALWQTGLLDEGIVECWIAAKLAPKWDMPLVEIGVALDHANKHAEAIRHLDESLKREPGPTALLRYTLGIAQLHAREYLGGLAQLESVIADEPKNAHALDGAAKCAFMARDERKGKEYAERAKRLGEDEAYRLWKSGAFAKHLEH